MESNAAHRISWKGWFASHSFGPKLDRLSEACCEIKAEERKILEHLEEFISWNLPSIENPETFALALTYSQKEHEAQFALWHRLENHLKELCRSH